ncbi:MAG: hypothetical protein KBA66_07175 [Leptospiraceae bacterium]|nr:hypothetical protein [Leptospiraceae bacterium]
MSQLELLKKTLNALEAHNIEYMLVGSFVSSLYGEPRSTQDIDMIVSINRNHIANLVKHFPPPKYYLDEELIQIAIENEKMFNLLDTEEGDKIDFYIQKKEPYEIEKFQRRIKKSFLGMEVFFLSPEDLILSKLVWSKKSGYSEKQFHDVKGVVRVQKDNLDYPYLEKKVIELKLEEFWERLKKEL